MTLHDVALTAKDTADSAMKVTEWLEYYAPATPAAQSSEQIVPSKLAVLDQMYAYYCAD